MEMMLEMKAKKLLVWAKISKAMKKMEREEKNKTGMEVSTPGEVSRGDESFVS